MTNIKQKRRKAKKAVHTKPGWPARGRGVDMHEKLLCFI